MTQQEWEKEERARRTDDTLKVLAIALAIFFLCVAFGGAHW
jgi:hypothetical protein